MAFKRSLFPLLVLLYLASQPVVLTAQKETANWYFGDSAGVRFSQGGVKALTDGVMKTREGCASISDKEGKLLFYTDGETVWNRFHMIMPNGTRLKGNKTSTQSAVIIKLPGSNSLYYIFTANGLTGNRELGSYYTVVDMSQNWGMGDVILKNFELLSQPAEKISAVFHENGTDVWITIAERETKLIHTFLLTEKGVNRENISNHVGVPIDGWAGYMKFSPRGDKLAFVQLQKHTLVYADFDRRSGKLSAVQSLWVDEPYGLEFSPNGRYVYVSRFVNEGDIVIQYDLESGDTNAVKQSAKAVVSGGQYNNYIHALQLASDGKIYFVQFDRDSLGCIAKPDMPGSLCQASSNVVGLAGRKNILGLPCFVQSYFALIPDDIAYKTRYKNCSYVVSFSINDTTGADSAWWNFGDGTPVVTGKYAVHTYPKPGTYTVILRVKRGTIYHSNSRQIYIDAANSFYMPDTLYQCSKTPLLLDHYQPGATYRWNTGATTAAIQAWDPGMYMLTMTDSNGCIYKDSTLVIRPQVYKPYLGPDTLLCYAEIIRLSDLSGHQFSKFVWNTGDSSRIIYGKQLNTYILTVTDAHTCRSADTVVIGSAAERPLYLPDAFSPDGNHINDHFPAAAFGFRYDDFKILNRWGEIIYHSTGSDAGWDGTYKGETVQQDVYVYIVSYHDCSNRRQNISGTVMVVR